MITVEEMNLMNPCQHANISTLTSEECFTLLHETVRTCQLKFSSYRSIKYITKVSM